VTIALVSIKLVNPWQREMGASLLLGNIYGSTGIPRTVPDSHMNKKKSGYFLPTFYPS
jgi:hypothetical protein